jgi:hypothetical protein
MRKYIGTSTISKKAKNRNRSRLRNDPITAGFEQQHPRQVALVVVVRVDPRDGEREQDPGEHHEEQRDAVDAEVPGDAPRRSIQECLLTNWKSGVADLKANSTHSVMPPVSTLVSSADDLHEIGRRLESATSSAPTAGTSTSMVRIGNSVACITAPSTITNQASSSDHAGTHAAGVVAHVAALGLAQLGRPMLRRAPGAVDRTVDHVRIEPRRHRRTPAGPGRP